MKDFSGLVCDVIGTGVAAALGTSAAVAACGQWERGDPIGPLNAVSHIAWGEEAFGTNEVDIKHTLAGLGLNAAAVMSWAVIHELLVGEQADRGNVVSCLIGGFAVSALAYVTDYYIVPRRFTPGFEEKLSGGSLCLIYNALALSLALGSLAGRQLRKS